MEIKFKARTQRVELGEYNPDMSEAHIDVWVNVTREMLARMLSVSAETPDEEFYDLLHQLWNADLTTPEETWPLEDIRRLHEHCRSYDPRLWTWVTNRTWSAVIEYQGLVKKK
jgi:hypothetical protein